MASKINVAIWIFHTVIQFDLTYMIIYNVYNVLLTEWLAYSHWLIEDELMLN